MFELFQAVHLSEELPFKATTGTCLTLSVEWTDSRPVGGITQSFSFWVVFLMVLSGHPPCCLRTLQRGMLGLVGFYLVLHSLRLQSSSITAYLCRRQALHCWFCSSGQNQPDAIIDTDRTRRSSPSWNAKHTQLYHVI